MNPPTPTQTPIDRIPFLRLLGMQQHPSPPGQSEISLPELKPEHCNLLPAAHGGGSLCTCQADVRQPDGTLVASAMGTFKYWKAPLGGIE